MVPLDFQFNPRAFQEDAIIVSFLKRLVIVSLFNAPFFFQSQSLLFFFSFLKLPLLLSHFLQWFCFILFNGPIFVSFLKSSKKFQAVAGIKLLFECYGNFFCYHVVSFLVDGPKKCYRRPLHHRAFILWPSSDCIYFLYLFYRMCCSCVYSVIYNLFFLC